MADDRPDDGRIERYRELWSWSAHAAITSLRVTVELVFAQLKNGTLAREDAKPVLDAFDDALRLWSDRAPMVAETAHSRRNAIRREFGV